MIEYKYPISTTYDLGFTQLKDFDVGKHEDCYHAYHIDKFKKDHKCPRCFLTWKHNYPTWHNASCIMFAKYDELLKILGKPLKISRGMTKTTRFSSSTKFNALFNCGSSPLNALRYPALSDVAWIGYFNDRKHRGRLAKDFFIIRDFGQGKNAHAYYHGYGDNELAKDNQNELNSYVVGTTDHLKRASELCTNDEGKFIEPENLKLSEIKRWNVSTYRHTDKYRQPHEIVDILQMYIDDL